MPDLESELDLRREMGSMSKDPLAWVLFSFAWGQGELSDSAGPEPWQRELLAEVRDGLKTYVEAIQEAVASGHGIGKSTLVAWLILWAMSTFEDTRGIVTANTATQLDTKTWPELTKWHRLFIAKHWFTVTATAIFSVDPEHRETWRIDAIPWAKSEKTNTESFAGLHNKGKRILIVFDEASAISDKIWEVTEGVMTDAKTEILWFAFGNPTRNTGRFHACFHSLRHRWKHRQIDSRNVSITDKAQLAKWEQDYGVDSDFFKVRVRGEFPAVGDRQFISSDLVAAARGKHLQPHTYSALPVILSLDPAWTGGDEIVIGKRQGNAYSTLMTLPKNDDDTVIAGYLAKFEDEHNADAVFIDLGYGTGVYSIGKAMNRKWQTVSFGAASTNPGCVNKRAEMWQSVKDWLKQGGAIPDDPVLAEELTGPEYIVKLDGRIQIESKDDMKKRGLNSPNRADALCLTFAQPVRRKASNDLGRKPEFAKRDYDVLAA